MYLIFINEFNNKQLNNLNKFLNKTHNNNLNNPNKKLLNNLQKQVLQQQSLPTQDKPVVEQEENHIELDDDVPQ